MALCKAKLEKDVKIGEEYYRTLFLLHSGLLVIVICLGMF